MSEFTTYKKALTVTSGLVDEGSHLNVKSAMELFQDSVTEQCEKLKISNFILRDKLNAFWVVTKNKIVIDRMPFFGERIFLETFPSKPSSRFCNWNCIALDSDEEPLWKAKSEMCILDFESQNVMRMKSTCFPMDLDFREPLDIAFDRIKTPENGEYIYTHQVRASDIDMSHHTNNVKYNSIAMDAFTCAETAQMKIRDYQIDFITQSHEGDKLEISRARTAGGWVVYGADSSDGHIVFSVKISSLQQFTK